MHVQGKGTWVYLVRKWLRSALQDGRIVCYRFKINADCMDWAVFGDEQYLKRRQSALSFECMTVSYQKEQMLKALKKAFPEPWEHMPAVEVPR
jgi:hypothetical protein